MHTRTAIMTLLPVGMALLAGALLPFQVGSNAAMGRNMGHPLWGALVSLAVGVVVAVPLLLALKVPAPAIGTALRGPWWLWIGGVLGAVYVGSAAVLTPKLGAAGFLACVVAGQMLVALAVDYFGLMGLAQKPLSVGRVVGVLLILAGVLIVQTAGELGEGGRVGVA